MSGNLVRHLDTASGGVFLSQDVRLVSLVHLLQEYESKDSVGPKPEVIGGESFPEGEKALVFNLEVAEIVVLRCQESTRIQWCILPLSL